MTKRLIENVCKIRSKICKVVGTNSISQVLRAYAVAGDAIGIFLKLEKRCFGECDLEKYLLQKDKYDITPVEYLLANTLKYFTPIDFSSITHDELQAFFGELVKNQSAKFLKDDALDTGYQQQNNPFLIEQYQELMQTSKIMNSLNLIGELKKSEVAKWPRNLLDIFLDVSPPDQEKIIKKLNYEYLEGIQKELVIFSGGKNLFSSIMKFNIFHIAALSSYPLELFGILYQYFQREGKLDQFKTAMLEKANFRNMALSPIELLSKVIYKKDVIIIPTSLCKISLNQISALLSEQRVRDESCDDAKYAINILRSNDHDHASAEFNPELWSDFEKFIKILEWTENTLDIIFREKDFYEENYKHDLITLLSINDLRSNTSFYKMHLLAISQGAVDKFSILNNHANVSYSFRFNDFQKLLLQKDSHQMSSVDYLQKIYSNNSSQENILRSEVCFDRIHKVINFYNKLNEIDSNSAFSENEGNCDPNKKYIVNIPEFEKQDGSGEDCEKLEKFEKLIFPWFKDLLREVFDVRELDGWRQLVKDVESIPDNNIFSELPISGNIMHLVARHENRFELFQNLEEYANSQDQKFDIIITTTDNYGNSAIDYFLAVNATECNGLVFKRNLCFDRPELFLSNIILEDCGEDGSIELYYPNTECMENMRKKIAELKTVLQATPISDSDSVIRREVANIYQELKHIERWPEGFIKKILEGDFIAVAKMLKENNISKVHYPYTMYFDLLHLAAMSKEPVKMVEIFQERFNDPIDDSGGISAIARDRVYNMTPAEYFYFFRTKDTGDYSYECINEKNPNIETFKHFSEYLGDNSSNTLAKDIVSHQKCPFKDYLGCVSPENLAFRVGVAFIATWTSIFLVRALRTSCEAKSFKIEGFDKGFTEGLKAAILSVNTIFSAVTSGPVVLFFQNMKLLTNLVQGLFGYKDDDCVLPYGLKDDSHSEISRYRWDVLTDHKKYIARNCEENDSEYKKLKVQKIFRDASYIPEHMKNASERNLELFICERIHPYSYDQTTIVEDQMLTKNEIQKLDYGKPSFSETFFKNILDGKAFEVRKYLEALKANGEDLHLTYFDMGFNLLHLAAMSKSPIEIFKIFKEYYSDYYNGNIEEFDDAITERDSVHLMTPLEYFYASNQMRNSSVIDILYNAKYQSYKAPIGSKRLIDVLDINNLKDTVSLYEDHNYNYYAKCKAQELLSGYLSPVLTYATDLSLGAFLGFKGSSFLLQYFGMHGWYYPWVLGATSTVAGLSVGVLDYNTNSVSLPAVGISAISSFVISSWFINFLLNASPWASMIPATKIIFTATLFAIERSYGIFNGLDFVGYIDSKVKHNELLMPKKSCAILNSNYGTLTDLTLRDVENYITLNGCGDDQEIFPFTPQNIMKNGAKNAKQISISVCKTRYSTNNTSANEGIFSKIKTWWYGEESTNLEQINDGDNEGKYVQTDKENNDDTVQSIEVVGDSERFSNDTIARNRSTIVNINLVSSSFLNSSHSKQTEGSDTSEEEHEGTPDNSSGDMHNDHVNSSDSYNDL